MSNELYPRGRRTPIFGKTCLLTSATLREWKPSTEDSQLGLVFCLQAMRHPYHMTKPSQSGCSDKYIYIGDVSSLQHPALDTKGFNLI